LPEIVQEIGSYAGLAAVAGLAVLSVLYFSQARDVKRLREWAGRAPERAAPQVVPGRVQAQQQPGQAQQQPGQPPPVPGAKPGAPQPPGKPQPAAPGQPAKPGAPQPATAGAQQQPGQPQQPGARPGAPAVAAAAGAGAASATQTKPPEAKPDGAGNAKPGAGAAPPAPGGPATPAGGRPPGAPPPVPAGQRPPVRPMLPPRPMPQQTAIIPPPRQPWYRRLLGNPRYLVLVVAGILVLGGASAFAVTQLSSDDGGTPPKNQPADDGGADAGERDQVDRPDRPSVVPSKVTVAVLNGTTVPGLAKQVGDEVESHGFTLGTVANTADQQQQRAESVVLYAPGHEREAMAVSRRLSINQRQPIDPASQELAGDATVVVIAGADRSP
jgi:hypothetical protein